MTSEVAYTSSALEYLHGVPRHAELGNASFVRHLPVNTISGANTINFSFPPSDDYIDLQECYMILKLKVSKADGGNLVAADNVAFVDNTPFSIFKSVVVHLNSTKITPSTIYQAYANYFASRFGTGKMATKIHLQELQGLTGEAPGQNDAKAAAAVGWTKRKGWTALSKEVQFITQIPNDFFRGCSSFLPPLQDLKLEFKLHDPDFTLVGTGNFKYSVTNLEIFTRQVPVASSTTMAIFKQQAVQPLKLNFTSLAIQSFTISAGKQTEFIRGIFPHEMPHQIFLMLVETDRINGQIGKDPFKFENGKVEKVILRQNGTPVMIEAINTHFDEEGDAKEAYFFMCQAFDVGNNSRDVNLTYEAFVKGSTMWAWTLSPDMDANSGIAMVQKPGNFEADIYVKNGHTTNPALTAIFLGKFCKTVEIGEENRTTLY